MKDLNLIQCMHIGGGNAHSTTPVSTSVGGVTAVYSGSSVADSAGNLASNVAELASNIAQAAVSYVGGYIKGYISQA